jgi:hypothetical protein
VPGVFGSVSAPNALARCAWVILVIIHLFVLDMVMQRMLLQRLFAPHQLVQGLSVLFLLPVAAVATPGPDEITPSRRHIHVGHIIAPNTFDFNPRTLSLRRRWS